MSAAVAAEEPGRISRSYTRSRRHPWVLGRLGDWVIPLGPYTPAQLVIAVVGAFVLIRTYAWWSFLGPVPVMAWGVSVWGARAVRVDGRSPVAAAWGALAYAVQPAGGRIGGRPAKDRPARLLGGGFFFEDLSAAPVRRLPAGAVAAAPASVKAVRMAEAETAVRWRPRGAGRRPEAVAAGRGVPVVTGVQQLMAARARGQR